MGRRWGEQEGTGEGDAAIGGAAAAAAGAQPAVGQTEGRAQAGNEAEGRRPFVLPSRSFHR